MALGVYSEVSVELVEEEDVQASDAVPLIEARDPLFVYALVSLKVGSIDGWLKRKRHS